MLFLNEFLQTYEIKHYSIRMGTDVSNDGSGPEIQTIMSILEGDSRPLAKNDRKL